MVVYLYIPRTHPRYFTFIPNVKLVLYLACLQKGIRRIKRDRTVPHRQNSLKINYDDGASVLFSLFPA